MATFAKIGINSTVISVTPLDDNLCHNADGVVDEDVVVDDRIACAATFTRSFETRLSFCSIVQCKVTTAILDLVLIHVLPCLFMFKNLQGKTRKKYSACRKKWRNSL